MPEPFRPKEGRLDLFLLTLPLPLASPPLTSSDGGGKTPTASDVRLFSSGVVGKADNGETWSIPSEEDPCRIDKGGKVVLGLSEWSRVKDEED